MADLQKTFIQDIVPKLKGELAIGNSMAAPRLSKIVLNIGLKDSLKEQKMIDEALMYIATIAGQRPVVTKAKKAIAGFKLRRGDKIGAMVTLRGARMYDFFERLVKIVLPRVRDFHGVATSSFDGGGNYSLGFSEITVFPEIDQNKLTRNYGLEVTINTTAITDEGGRKLLELLGMPFRKAREQK